MATQDWHHEGSAFCTPMGTCCLTLWLPCVTYGRTHHRVKNNGDMSDYSSCNSSCVGFTALTAVGLSWVMPMLNRGNMRAKYNLEGSGCTDCLCACFCTPCDLTQQDKEAEYREEQNKAMMAQPGKEGTMNYAPQQ